MSSRVLCASGLVVSATLAWSRGAAAAEPFELVWEAPGECPTGPAVRAEVLELAALEEPAPHRVVARARVRMLAEGSFRLDLTAELDGSAGERTLEGVTCRSVTDAVVLTLALMLNPDADVAPESKQGASAAPLEPASPAPRATSSATAPRRPAPSESPPWPIAVACRVNGGVRTGALPDAALEAGLAGGALAGPLSAWLSVSASPPQTGEAEQGAGRGRLWSLSLGGRFGWHARFERWRLGPLVGLEWTRAAGEGSGVSDPEAAAIHWWSAEFGAAAALTIAEHFDVSAGGFGLLPLARPKFYLEGEGQVYQPQSLGFRAYLGLELHAP